MAAFRVFISSTYRDLHSIRSAIASWVETQGHDAVLFERGDVTRGYEGADDSSFRSIRQSDAVVCIIGKNYGTDSSARDGSITANELREAVSEGKLTFIFVDQNVLAEHQTWTLNPESDIKYAHVEDPRVFQFLDEIRKLGLTYPVSPFKEATDIVDHLRRQFSGLLNRYVTEKSADRDFDMVQQLQRALQDLRAVADFMRQTSEEGKTAWQKVHSLRHPFFLRFQKIRGYPLPIPVFRKDEFVNLLTYLGYQKPEKRRPDEKWELPQNQYKKAREQGKTHLHVQWDRIYDPGGDLIPMSPEEWDDTFLELSPADDWDPFSDE